MFLVPVAADRYELYCEEPDEPAPQETPPSGVLNRVNQRFRQTLADAERERRRVPDPSEGRPPLPTRAKRRLLRWVAESIAEQRLLWQLRRRAEAALDSPRRPHRRRRRASCSGGRSSATGSVIASG